MRFAVEQWAPEYGSPAGIDSGGDDPPTTGATPVDVDVGVELGPGSWRPIVPSTAWTGDVVGFVDGVRRIDARLWVSTAGGDVAPGICASYAAGVVRCGPASAAVDAVVVERALFGVSGGHGAGLATLATRHGVYTPRPVVPARGVEATDALTLALQDAMGDLEQTVSAAVGDVEMLFVDGPLRERVRLPGAIGYVKTHRVSYLPDRLRTVVAALEAGARTPLFLVGGRFRRWSWYLRLPGGVGHPWAGVVRCEVSADRSLGDARSVADGATVVLGRLSSAPHKDPRAPQNLYPIGGLERVLRRRLGDAGLLYRGLRRLATAGAPEANAAGTSTPGG